MRKPLIVVDLHLATEQKSKKIIESLREYLGEDYYVIGYCDYNIKVYGTEFTKIEEDESLSSRE